ncbi:DUF1440 domain-containing protein [Cytophagaceae bacterium YF14B1]|uniref:DUF1440 domain-containing protein n=1 Tax=Xanthocytophaga flava TaxID=3048013 RepID=A0AAE3QKE4_9BACT|nr:DUF1440 domain-containing protein [Xanthocytophaga flavus]MDJ1479105.1 DUF1440 domain-containing protein [Xanthocytophaga flavus]
MAHSSVSPNVPTSLHRGTQTILKAGVVAGILDLTTAMIVNYLLAGTTPVRLLLFIASGIFGKEAFSGGIPMALLGLFLHFFIAMTFAFFYFLLYPRIQTLAKHKIVAGLLYGVFAWIVMNQIVLPLSNTPKFPFNPVKAAIGMLVLMCMIGLPISIIVHKYFRRS